MSDDADRILKPVNFGLKDSLNKTPLDRFGQRYNSDEDSSKFSDESPADSRRYHNRSDADVSSRSLHHTLGMGNNQASPGNHIHDGITSKKIGPLEMDPTNVGKTRPVWTIPNNPSVADLANLLKNFIEFRQV
ncbi:hypothetical protein [Streptomyces hebeiensis]